MGAFAILGFEFLLHVLFDFNITGFFRGRLGLHDPQETEANSTLRATVFVGIAFAIGLLTEDLSFLFEDPRSIPFGHKIPFMEVTSRARWGVMTDGEAGNRRPSGLARELARERAFTNYLDGRADAPAVQQWFVGTCGAAGQLPCESADSIIGPAMQELYYFAKNLTYQVPNYYDELRRLQTRNDFSRAILMLSVVYTGMAILLVIVAHVWQVRGLLACIKVALQGKGQDNATPGTATPGKPAPQRRRFCELACKERFGRSGLVIVMPALIVLLSWAAHWREATEFNKRALGYFASGIRAERLGFQWVVPPEASR